MLGRKDTRSRLIRRAPQRLGTTEEMQTTYPTLYPGASASEAEREYLEDLRSNVHQEYPGQVLLGVADSERDAVTQGNAYAGQARREQGVQALDYAYGADHALYSNYSPPDVQDSPDEGEETDFEEDDGEEHHDEGQETDFEDDGGESSEDEGGIDAPDDFPSLQDLQAHMFVTREEEAAAAELISQGLPREQAQDAAALMAQGMKRRDARYLAAEAAAKRQGAASPPPPDSDEEGTLPTIDEEGEEEIEEAEGAERDPFYEEGDQPYSYDGEDEYDDDEEVEHEPYVRIPTGVEDPEAEADEYHRGRRQAPMNLDSRMLGR